MSIFLITIKREIGIIKAINNATKKLSSDSKNNNEVK